MSLLKATYLSILLFSVTGCAFMPIGKCQLPEEGIMESCKPEVDLSRVDYVTRLQQHRVDRKSLAECSAKHHALVESLKSCNRQIETYNKAKGKME